MWGISLVIFRYSNCFAPPQARTDIEQIARVIQVLGTPSDWPGINDLPDYKKIIFPTTEPPPWHVHFPANTAQDACDLAAQLVAFNPQKRLTAQRAREHPFFGNGNALAEK